VFVERRCEALRGGAPRFDEDFGELRAWFLLSKAGRLRVGDKTDPQCTLGASALEEYLPPN
jgi:hypothetical protein